MSSPPPSQKISGVDAKMSRLSDVVRITAVPGQNGALDVSLHFHFLKVYVFEPIHLIQ